MSISVNHQPILNSATSFKGGWKHTANGSQYYSSNAATTAGCVIGAIYAFDALALKGFTSFLNNKLKNASKNSKKSIEMFKESMEQINKKSKENYILLGTLGIGSVLCGLTVDLIRNKKAANTADYVTQVGTRNAVLSGDNIEIAKSGRAYYHSNAGVKYGGLLGAGLGAISGLILKAFGMKTNIVGVISSAISIGIGGLIMGAISDGITNSSAKKHS